MGKIKKIGIVFGSLILITFVLLIVIGFTTDPTERFQISGLSEDEIKIQALEDISTNELYENSDEYVGKIIHYQGTTHGILHQSGDIYSLNVVIADNEPHVSLSYVFSEEPDAFMDIEFYAKMTGISETKSLIGSTILLIEADGLIVSYNKTS